MVASQIGYSVLDSLIHEMFLPGARSSAGFPSPADDYLEKSLDLNELLIANKVATFFMRVEGDSLKASGIRNGDMLIVDRSINPSHGKIVVAVVSGELVVRRVESRDGKLVLTSDDASIESAVIDGEEIQVWGVATSSVHIL
ncbi:MAG: translesion error-prone DNA polymerase V autoproteolytic subunit [Candidatus Obscuribacterales bacterium]|nr:translesion error-prone DNA polymerase V autoproteolytic subunit [Candidatus Obscuribacterales bacterium]